MVKQQLIDYIRTSQQGGMSLDVIKQDLLSVGWNQSQIDEACQAVNIPKPSISILSPTKSSVSRKYYTSPFSAMLAIVLVLSLLILAQNVVTDILDRFAPEASVGGFLSSHEYREFKQGVNGNYKSEIVIYNTGTDYNSYDPLYNQYFAKYKTRTVSPSFRMILNAIVVLPFWIMTFLLFICLKEERKKYGVLLRAYYITSGWLLIFLFFSVARYIWTSNTVIGVYVVLGMLVIILTSSVWGVQKYRHSIEN